MFQIVNLTHSEDFGQREIGLLLIKQLCSSEQNALTFIDCDVVSKLLRFFEVTALSSHVESAAGALEQVLLLCCIHVHVLTTH